MNDISRLRADTVKHSKIKHQLSGWLIILPGTILFLFFIWVPLIQTVRLSVYSTQGMDTLNFVGIKNFINVIKDADFIPALRNTFLYTFWSLIIGFVLPIIIAMLLNEAVHLKGLFRLGSYLPNIVPGLAAILMWQYIFGSGETGVLNIVLKSLLGVPAQEWLTSSFLVIPVIVIIMTWKGAGATALIYLAGLQGINPELYEAAALDGAGVWKRIWHVTIPNIFNLGRTLLILQIISVFQILYEPLVLTNGGPNDSSMSLMLLMYNYAFVKFDYASASAVSLIIAVLLILFTGLYLKLLKQKDM